MESGMFLNSRIRLRTAAVAMRISMAAQRPFLSILLNSGPGDHRADAIGQGRSESLHLFFRREDLNDSVYRLCSTGCVKC